MSTLANFGDRCHVIAGSEAQNETTVMTLEKGLWEPFG